MDNATLPGEDHPEARAKSIDNLKRIGLAMGGDACANGRKFPPAAIRKDSERLLSWRVAILPYLDVYRGARLFKKFRLDGAWTASTTQPFWRRCQQNTSRSFPGGQRRLGLTIKDLLAPRRCLTAWRGRKSPTSPMAWAGR